MYAGRKLDELSGNYSQDFFKAKYTNASVIVLGITRQDINNSKTDSLTLDTHSHDYYASVGTIIASSEGFASRGKIGEFYLSNKVSILTNLNNNGKENALWKDVINGNHSAVGSGSTVTDGNATTQTALRLQNNRLGAQDIVDYSGIKTGRYIFTPSYQSKVTQVGLDWQGVASFLSNAIGSANFNPLQVNYMNTVNGMNAVPTRPQYGEGDFLTNSNKSLGFWGMYLNDTRSTNQGFFFQIKI